MMRSGELHYIPKLLKNTGLVYISQSAKSFGGVECNGE